MTKYPIYIIVSLLLSFLLIFFFVWPKFQELSSLKEKISVKRSELQSQEKYFQELEKTSEELKKYETSLSNIDSALPQNPLLPELLNFLQKASSQSGLSLKSISSPSTASGEAEKIKETRISLVLVGSYSDFKNFLSVLEKSARLIEVENLSFFIKEIKEKGPIDFNLATKVYSY